jgi:hypothetical protein
MVGHAATDAVTASGEAQKKSSAVALIFTNGPRTGARATNTNTSALTDGSFKMNAKPLSRVGVACAGLAAGLSVAAAPAIARPIPNSTPPGLSQYLAGYDVADTGNLTTTSIVQVPNAKCANQKDYEHLFLGQLLTPAAGDASQGGSNDATAAIAMTCMGLGKAPFFYGEADTANGEEGYVSVHPGDLVETQISDSYGGNTTATTTDLNDGDTATSTGASTGDDTQLYLGAVPDVGYEQEGPLVDYAIPKFTAAKFNDTVVNGSEWNLSGPTAFSLQQNSDIQLKTAPVPSAPTYSFTLTELHTR